MPKDPLQHQSPKCRLNKFLARAGVCSRRKADEYIASGRVKVNGLVVDQLGSQVQPDQDQVQVDGETLSPCQSRSGQDYILLFKPVRVLTTASDPQGRKTVFDLLPGQASTRRVFPVGRLDFMSEGLLLLTSNGELANRLTHPRWHVDKVYQVLVAGRVSKVQYQPMTRGMTLNDGLELAPVEVQTLQVNKQGTWLELTLRQGVNRQIRRMCRDLGLKVLRLKRVRQGPIVLGELRPGQWRRLSKSEIDLLKDCVGLANKGDQGSPRPWPC